MRICRIMIKIIKNEESAADVLLMDNVRKEIQYLPNVWKCWCVRGFYKEEKLMPFFYNSSIFKWRCRKSPRIRTMRGVVLLYISQQWHPSLIQTLQSNAIFIASIQCRTRELAKIDSTFFSLSHHPSFSSFPFFTAEFDKGSLERKFMSLWNPL